MRPCVGLFALIAATASLQQTIRVDVNLVNVAFSVRDSAGKLVTNLGKEDFDVWEDGSPQAIAFLARSADVPLTLGMVVDFSGSQREFIRDHRRDLRAFLKSILRPSDRAFLVGFGSPSDSDRNVRLVSDLAASAEKVNESLLQYERASRSFPVLGAAEDRGLGSPLFDAIYHAVEQRLATVESGSRALIVLSDGEDNSSAHHMMDAVQSAQTGNVAIFALRYTEIKNGRATAANKYGVRVMERLAAETGGGHFDASEEDLRDHFGEIEKRLRSSYDLAYHSTNPNRDGLFRKVVIRAKQPGLTVRCKRVITRNKRGRIAAPG